MQMFWYFGFIFFHLNSLLRYAVFSETSRRINSYLIECNMMGIMYEFVTNAFKMGL